MAKPRICPAEMTKRNRTRATIYAAGLIAMMTVFSTWAAATELKPDTVAAWDQYAEGTKAQMQRRARGERSFLWLDDFPEQLKRVRQGEIVVAPLGNSEGRIKVPHGLIHDWIGAAFIPNVTLGEVVRVVGDYGRYAQMFGPAVVESKLVKSSTLEKQVHLLMMQKALSVTAAADIDDDVHTVLLSHTHAYCLSYATRVVEIKDYGTPGQRPFPEGDGPGYVWRLLTLTRMEERDGGVYIEDETVEMSRDISVAFRWLVKPLTEKLPRDMMFLTLKQTRDAISTQEKHVLANDKKLPAVRLHGPSIAAISTPVVNVHN